MVVASVWIVIDLVQILLIVLWYLFRVAKGHKLALYDTGSLTPRYMSLLTYSIRCDMIESWNVPGGLVQERFAMDDRIWERADISERVDLRASDKDRERTVAVLRKGFAAGRISLAEFEERTERVYRSLTLPELEQLVRDIPQPRPRFPHVRVNPQVGAYILVMVLLIAIWAASGAGYFWPMWPMLGWGIGLLKHGGRGRSGLMAKSNSNRRYGL